MRDDIDFLLSGGDEEPAKKPEMYEVAEATVNITAFPRLRSLGSFRKWRRTSNLVKSLTCQISGRWRLVPGPAQAVGFCLGTAAISPAHFIQIKGSASDGFDD